MAKVNRYDRIVNADQVQESMVNLAGGEARATAQIANTAVDVGVELDKRIKDAQATTWITQASVDLRKRMQQRELDLQQQFGENPEGYSSALEQAFYKESQSLQKGAPNVMATRAWSKMSGDYASKITDTGMTWERNRKIENYTIGLDKSLQDLATVAYRDRNPGNWQGYVDQIDSAMEGAKTLLSPAQIEEVRKNAMSSLGANFFNGVYEQNPRAARALIDSKALDGAVDPSKLASLRERADNEIKRQAREAEQARTLARIEARSQAADIEAALRAGGDVDVPEEVLSVMKPEERKQWQERIDSARKFGQDAALVAYASPEELQGVISERTESLNSRTAQGFKAQARDMSDLTQILSQRNAAIQKDPAGYAAQSPAMKQTLEELQASAGEPETAAAANQKYVQRLVDEQRRLGVPENRVRYIPQTTAANMVNQFASAKDVREKEQLLQSWQQVYGRYWNSIAYSLKEAGMPSGFTAATKIGATDPMGGRLLTALSDPKSVNEAIKGVPSISKKINDQMVDVMKSYANQFNGTTMYNDLRDGTALLAGKLISEGEDPDNAVSKAAEAIKSRYQFEDTYRIPRVDAGTNKVVDTKIVKRNLQDIRNTLNVDEVDLPDDDTGLREGVYKKNAEYWLRNQTFWVNSQVNGHDDGGFMLMWKSGMPVTKKGRPLTWKVDDVNKKLEQFEDENQMRSIPGYNNPFRIN